MLRARLAALLILGLAGCDKTKSEAEAALTRADRMVTAVAERATKVLPDETKTMVDSLAAAKAHAAAGDHKAVLVTARDVAAQAIAIANALPGKSTEYSSAFMAFSAELPNAAKAIKDRLDRLSGGGRLPAGLDQAKLVELRTEVAGWGDTWKAAVANFNQGNLGLAMATVTKLKQRVGELNALLGIGPSK